MTTYDAWKTDAGCAPQGCAYCADTEECPACHGSGIETDDNGVLIDEPCERCHGTGLCDECVESGEPKPVTDECPECAANKARGGYGPSHDGSRYCHSGSIASGGRRAHCTCDTCW